MPNLVDPLLYPSVGVSSGITLASGDVTLTGDQIKCEILEVTTGHASNAIIAPAVKGATFWVVNNDGTLAANIKKSGGTAVTIAATKKAQVYFNGTNYIRLTADQ